MSQKCGKEQEDGKLHRENANEEVKENDADTQVDSIKPEKMDVDYEVAINGVEKPIENEDVEKPGQDGDEQLAPSEDEGPVDENGTPDISREDAATKLAWAITDLV